MRLRKFKQRTAQSVQVFSEVLNARALETYDDEIATPTIQRELVSIYCQGLTSHYVAVKVIEQNPEKCQTGNKDTCRQLSE